MKKQPVIKVLKVEPDKAPELIEMKNELEAMQAIVGGYIEVFPLADDAAIVCNEEGKMNGMELNRPIYHNGEIVEIIAGTFFIAGDDYKSGEFVSLKDEQIAQYSKQFHTPVTFIKIGNKIVAVPR
jgi:hypothetical protein